MTFQPGDRKLFIKPGCIVCKTCEFMAPDVFHVPEKGLTAVVLQTQPSPEQLASVLEAVKSCPETVIQFRREKAE